MTIEDMPAEIPAALVTLWSEVVHGPSAESAYLLNRGDRGLLESLRTLSAETASARPGGRSSVAAHVDHVRYGLELLNRWAEGEENPWANANFAASWRRQHVDEEHWRALQKALALEAGTWGEALKRPRVWEANAITGAVASVAHVAYHLGAIRQLAQTASRRFRGVLDTGHRCPDHRPLLSNSFQRLFLTKNENAKGFARATWPSRGPRVDQDRGADGPQGKWIFGRD